LIFKEFFSPQNDEKIWKFWALSIQSWKNLKSKIASNHFFWYANHEPWMKAYDIVNGGSTQWWERAHSSSSLNILIEEKKKKVMRCTSMLQLEESFVGWKCWPRSITKDVSILGFLLHGENSSFGENCEKDAHNTSNFITLNL